MSSANMAAGPQFKSNNSRFHVPTVYQTCLRIVSNVQGVGPFYFLAHKTFLSVDGNT